MRKIKTIATCMLLGTAMVLSAVTPAVAADPVTTGEGESDIQMIYENDCIISGKLSPSEQQKKTRIRVEKASKIEVSSDPDDSECDLAVRFRDENGVIRDIFLKPGESDSIYLLAGTYDMNITSSVNGKIRFPHTEKSYSIHYYEGTCWDAFEETADAQDGTMETANKIGLGNYAVYGSIVDNESKVDVFQFHSYYDDVPVSFNLYSRIPGDFGLSWSVYTPEALTCLENGDIGGAAASTGGTVIVPKGKDYQHAHEDMALSKGTYYLVFSSPSSGVYSFSVVQKPSDGCERMNPIFTTVGSSFLMNPEQNLTKSYSLTWESYEPDVVSLNDPTFANLARAEKAGSASVYGYGTQTLLLTGETGHAYIDAWVKVEFTDVIHKENWDDNPYYYNPVYWAVDRGITEGYKDKDGYYSKFKPQNDCTRAQILTFMWRMKGSPEPITLTDYPDVKETDYFYKAVSWAQENGITEGYPDGTFKPGNKCSRSQIVTFLWRLAGRPEPNHISDFKDVKDPETYFYKAVSWAEERWITEGYPDGTFKPANKCTRGQAVTFLYRYSGENQL